MILVKTELGQRVLKDRSIALSQRQRAALILFDGKRTLKQVLAATAATGVTADDVEQLQAQNLLALQATVLMPPPAADERLGGWTTAFQPA